MDILEPFISQLKHKKSPLSQAHFLEAFYMLNESVDEAL